MHWNYSLPQNSGVIKRIDKMSFSEPTDNGMLQIFFYYMELFKTVPAYLMFIYLFLQILRFRYKKTLIEIEVEYALLTW